ncbi:MAG: nucleoside hydrolase [Nitrospirae bacterium]|nr:nucleoside hydrolase [Nitrospirota bacterium]
MIPSLIAIAAACSSERSGTRLLIIDDDVGFDLAVVRREGAYDAPFDLKVPFTDPDGGLEVIYAGRDPSVELLGVTCLFGTVYETTCEGAARKALDAINGPDIPVLAGAISPFDLGQATPAADFIIQSVLSHPGDVEIVASGPLTNIATALMIEPSIRERWKALHVLSGEFRMGSDIQQFEALLGGDLNLSTDYPAAKYVFENGGPFPLYPNELMDEVLFNRTDLAEIAAAGTPLSALVVSETEEWMRLFSTAAGVDGFYPHGMTGIAAVLDPTYSPVEYTFEIRLEAIGEPTGRHYWGSIATVRGSEGEGPAHAIRLRFEEPERFRQAYLQRLR